MIPNRPPPRLQSEGRWSKEFVDFIKKCLVVNPAERSSADQLLEVVCFCWYSWVAPFCKGHCGSDCEEDNLMVCHDEHDQPITRNEGS